MIEKYKMKATLKSKILKNMSNDRDSIFLVLFFACRAWRAIGTGKEDSPVLATIRDDTWKIVLNMQTIIPNSKRWDYSDIPSGGTEKIKGPAYMVEGDHHLRIYIYIHIHTHIYKDVGQYGPLTKPSESIPKSSCKFWK